MVKTPDSNHGKDDIDLLQLLLKVISTIRNNFLLILIFFVVGTILGVAYFMASRKQFENRMIISSNILTISYGKILFDNATTHIQEGDYGVLANDLKIPVETAKEIVSLRIESLTNAQAGEAKESERYLITAFVYDQAILPDLQQGLINYLENNEFVKIRVEQNRTFLNQMIASIDRELSDLQQFKTQVHSGKFFTEAKGNVMFDPTSVNSKILEMTQKRIEYKNALELSNSVQLIEGFTPFKYHKSPSLVVSLATGSMVGLFAVGVLIAFKSIRRLLRMAEANSVKNAA
jgi:hypothetical protein